MAEDTTLDTIHDDGLQDEALDRMPGENSVRYGFSIVCRSAGPS